jgi:AcrR family transcriptional regulator
MDSQQSTRMDRKKEITRNKVISTAIELFTQYGLDAVTMEQIADTADIAKGTLYNYFPAKEIIINAYIQKSFSDNKEERMAQFKTLPDTRTRLTWLITLLVEGVNRQKQIFETFMVYRMKNVTSFHPIQEAEASGLTQLIQEIITLGINAKELRSDLPRDILEGLVEYTLIEAIKPMYIQSNSFDPHQRIDHCVNLFLNGTKA